IEGTVKFTGALTIEGRVVGDIFAESDKDSVVRITANGRVTGEVRSPDVIINGHVNGDVFASGQLVLASDAVVDGNVHYNLIEMEKGAQINGNMVHSAPGQSENREAQLREAKRIKPDEAPNQKELAAG
ncbi:MAG: polymer-forming cytoskeletal protein, partial [Pseudomonadales bacterium]